MRGISSQRRNYLKHRNNSFFQRALKPSFEGLFAMLVYPRKAITFLRDTIKARKELLAPKYNLHFGSHLTGFPRILTYPLLILFRVFEILANFVYIS